MANVGIRLFELLTKRAAPKEQGMVAGGVFRPIPSETPLGLTRHHPYDPFCNFKHGRNPHFCKSYGHSNRTKCSKSGSLRVDPYAYPQPIKVLKQLHTCNMDVGCSLRGFGGLYNSQNSKNAHQKPILASKMPTSRGILG